MNGQSLLFGILRITDITTYIDPAVLSGTQLNVIYRMRARLAKRLNCKYFKERVCLMRLMIGNFSRINRNVML